MMDLSFLDSPSESYYTNESYYTKIKRLDVLRQVKKGKRTVTYLHSLWKKASQRAEERRLLIRKFIEERIITTVEPNEKGEYVIYFDLHDNVYKYIIRWDSEHMSYSWSSQRFRGTDRSSKIDLFTVDTSLGNDFYYVEDIIQSTLGGVVFSKMWGGIQEWLRKNHKPSPMEYSGIIRIKLEDTVYLIDFNKQNRYYCSYNWIGEDKCMTFEIK
jgi:hypothetical protein